MKRKTLLMLCITAIAVFLLSTTAFAIDESQVESAIAASSREEVAGNVFIWFLCAVAFLKVSQKIDSFMSGLGINVGRTGGSMLGELMIAGRAIGAAARTTGGASGAGASGGSVFNRVNSNNSTTNRAAGQGFPGGGGIIGAVQRAAGNSAVSSATGKASGLRNTIGNAMFTSSMKNNGKFAADVVSTVATGNIASVGTISGPQASDALRNYLGYGSSVTSAAPGTAEQSRVHGQASEVQRADAGVASGTEDVPSQSSIHADAPGAIPSAPGAESSNDTARSVGKGTASSPQSGGGVFISQRNPGGSVPGSESTEPIPAAPGQHVGDVITPDGGAAAGAEFPHQGGHSSTSTGDNVIPMSRAEASVSGGDIITPNGGTAAGVEFPHQSGHSSTPSGDNVIPMSRTGSPASSSDVITPDGGAAAGAEFPYQTGHSSTPSGDNAVPLSRSAKSKSGGDIITPNGGATAGSELPRQNGHGSSPTTGSAIPMSRSASPKGGEDVITPSGGTAAAAASQTASGPEPVNSIPSSPPTFRDVEIGGGRITGYETPSGGGPERQFAMYNTAQYMEPTGSYEKVQTVDGQSWYKQYAEPTVQKTPYESDNGRIMYDEKIVDQLPQIPKRKDRV